MIVFAKDQSFLGRVIRKIYVTLFCHRITAGGKRMMAVSTTTGEKTGLELQNFENLNLVCFFFFFHFSDFENH